MRGQPQIIVRCQVDHLLAVEGADGRLLVLEHAQLEVRALGLEFVELAGEIRERIVAGCSGHDSLKPVATDAHGSTRIQISWSCENLTLLNEEICVDPCKSVAKQLLRT